MNTISSPKLAWFSLSLFYLYQYALRVFPSVAEHDLRTDFLLNAFDFSTLGAFYLYAYGGMQLPLGALVDSLGLRRVVLSAISLCILGALLFFTSSSFFHLQLGRVLMGMGGAPVFMCALKICADYIPAGHRGLYMGITLTMGTFGALLTGNIVVSLIEEFGWRNAILMIGVLGLLVAALLFFNIPKQSTRKQKTLLDTVLFKKVFGNKIVYIYGILGLGFFASLSVFADLWGTAYLVKRFGVDRSEAAGTSMILYMGLALGSLVLPWYFEKKNRLFWGVKLCAFSLLVLFSTLLFVPALSFGLAKILLFSLGFFSGAIMLSFTGAALEATVETSGLTISLVNMFNMFGGAILNQLIGRVMDSLWDGTKDMTGVPQYTLFEFNEALSLVLGSLFVGCFILSLFLRRSDRKAVKTSSE